MDEIKYELTAEGTELNKKIVYMLTVKVTEERELALTVGETLIKTRRVVGTQTLHQLLQQSLTLVPTAQKVNQVSGAVTQISTDVIAGKVIVQGFFCPYLLHWHRRSKLRNRRTPAVCRLCSSGSSPTGDDG